MAKHAHRLMLNQKKTWRCTLPGCNYFIHIGLAHILPGKASVCWECGDEFTLDERALQDDQPKCNNCRSTQEHGRSSDELSEIIEAKIALAKCGVKYPHELDKATLSSLKMFGKLTDRAIEAIENIDKPTSEE